MIKRYGVAASCFVAIVIAVVLALRHYWLLSHPFSITNIKEGQQFSGYATVDVHVVGNIRFVELAVDGETYSARNTDTYGSDHEASFDLPTWLWKNGSHTLQIKAYSRVYDQRHVIFVNGLHP